MSDREGRLRLKPIGHVQSPFGEKFGIPRQAGLVEAAKGRLKPVPPYDNPAAWRGIEAFSHLWLIWQFHAHGAGSSLTVRPPRLGGNERLGVFATRSSFRPNPLALSLVRLDGVEIINDRVQLALGGVDLLDGTPVLDVKPYLPWADCPQGAHGGFADQRPEATLTVDWEHSLAPLLATIPEHTVKLMIQTLAQDPRPAWHDDPDRLYGMQIAGWDLRFKVRGNQALVVELVAASDTACDRPGLTSASGQQGSPP